MSGWVFTAAATILWTIPDIHKPGAYAPGFQYLRLIEKNCGLLPAHPGRRRQQWNRPRPKKYATGMFFASLRLAGLFDSVRIVK